MRLLVKAFVQKQLRSILVLGILSFLVLMAIQVTTTVWAKNLTLVERVDRVNGTHMYLYLNEDATIFPPPFTQLKSDYYDEMILEYAKSKDTLIHTDRTYAFPYVAGYFDKDIYVMGYTSDDTNLYEVLEGAPLDSLTGYEIAITESYARMLRNEGIEPIGHTLSFPAYDDVVDFQIVSVIDYVNINDAYVKDVGLKQIPLFDFPFVSVAFGAFDTLREIALEYPSLSKQVIQIRFEDYSRVMEAGLVKHLLDSFTVDVVEEKLLPLFEVTDYMSTNEQLFKHISIITLAVFMVATAYSFLIYIKRQLKQNTANIGLLSIVGITDRSIVKVFMLRLLLIFAFALLLIVLLNVGVVMMFQNDRSLANVFDLNRSIGLISILVALVYFFVIAFLYKRQIDHSIKTSLSSIKTKQQHFITDPQIHSPTLSILTAFKSLFAHRGFILSSMIIVTSLLVMIISNVLIFYQMNHIYNKETLGMKFDYIVTDAPFAHFEFTSQYADHQVMLEKTSNLYFVEIDYKNNIRSYYKSNMIVFNSYMAPFVDVVEGTTPPDLDKVFWEDKLHYTYSMASRKHMDIRNGFVYNDENLEKYWRVPARGYLFYAIPHRFYHNRETAAKINGTFNSLIDNGWIAYVYRERPMFELFAPYMEMYLIDMKDDVDPILFEQAMDQQNIQYMSNAKIIEALNQANQENQRNIFYFIVFLSSLLVIVMLTNLSAYGSIQAVDHKEDYRLYQQIGLKIKTQRMIKINQALIFGLGILLLTQIGLWVFYPLIFDGVLKAYGLYYTIELPTLLNHGWTIVLGISLILALLINLPYKLKRQ